MLEGSEAPVWVGGSDPYRRRKEPVIAEAATLTPLPAALRDEPVVVKLLFLWLPLQEGVVLSQRGMARALGVSQGAVSLSLARLRVLGLSSGQEEPGQAPGGSPKGQSIAPALPKALLEESPTTKLVYLYLRPYSEVAVSVRGLEALLGISHRPAAEAMQRLLTLELLEVLRPPSNSPGRYKLPPT